MTSMNNSDFLAPALPSLAVQVRPALVIATEQSADVAARETLLDAAFGPARFTKSSQKLRLGRLPARGLSLVARLDGALVGTVRLWHVVAGTTPALLLGPLAVDSRHREHGIGSMLMRQAIEQAQVFGHRAILLVGDAPYYARFGFSRQHALGLRMPGPVDPDRFLGLELQGGALREARGLLRPTGVMDLNGAQRNAFGRSGLKAAA